MKIPLKIILIHLQFYKRNPLKFFEKKNNPGNLVSKIPSWTGKLETIFEKSHRSSVILKTIGATPQLVQNLIPISCGGYFYTSVVITQDPPFDISKNKKI